MARKFILVPSEQFQHLQSAVQEEPLIEHTKNNIQAILKNPRLNISTKKALFDQEQLRLLRQRKEKAEKPVKVTITGPKTTGVPAIRKTGPTKPAAYAREEGEEQFEDQYEEEQGEQKERRQEEEDEEAFKTPESSKSRKKTPRGSAKRQKRQQDYVVKTKIEGLIEQYPATFGVELDSSGIIHPTSKRVVNRSNWRTSLNYLTGGEGYDAPGTSYLDRILRNNELTKEDFAKIRTIQKGSGFIPSLWT